MILYHWHSTQMFPNGTQSKSLTYVIYLMSECTHVPTDANAIFFCSSVDDTDRLSVQCTYTLILSPMQTN